MSYWLRPLERPRRVARAGADSPALAWIVARPTCRNRNRNRIGSGTGGGNDIGNGI